MKQPFGGHTHIAPHSCFDCVLQGGAVAGDFAVCAGRLTLPDWSEHVVMEHKSMPAADHWET